MEPDCLDKGNYNGNITLDQNKQINIDLKLTENTSQKFLYEVSNVCYKELLELHWKIDNRKEFLFNNITNLKLTQKEPITFKAKFYQKNIIPSQFLKNVGQSINNLFSNNDINSALITKSAKIIYDSKTQEITTHSIKIKFKNTRTGHKGIFNLSRKQKTRIWMPLSK